MLFFPVTIVGDVFLRLFAVVCLINFVSLLQQFKGLIGAAGLIPVSTSVVRTQKRCHRMRRKKINIVDWFAPNTIYFLLLTLVHNRFNDLRDPNGNLLSALHFDIAVSLLAVVYPHCVLFCYMYWSLLGWKCVFADFMQFSCDNLLLESLAYAALLSLLPDPMSISLGVWQFKLLALRVILSSVMRKYRATPDSKWNFVSLLTPNHTDLASYLLTQPLPTHLALCLSSYFTTELTMFAAVYHYFEVVLHLVILPCLMLTASPNVNRLIACYYCIHVIVTRVLMGHYGWTPLLSLTLSVSLLVDQDMPWMIQFLYYFTSAWSHSSPLSAVFSALRSCSDSQYGGYYVGIILLSYLVGYTLHLLILAIQMVALCYTITNNRPLRSDGDAQVNDGGTDVITSGWVRHLYEEAVLLHYLARVFYCLGNDYTDLYPSHRVASMGENDHIRRGMRQEVSISVSADKVVWHEVDFAFKPGGEYLPPKSDEAGIVCRLYHMPRLDWSMWFLPFSAIKASYPRWLWVMLISILEGNKDVLDLLHPNVMRVLNLLVNGIALDGKRHREKLFLREDRDQVWVRVCRKIYRKRVDKLLRDKQAAGTAVPVSEEMPGSYWTTTLDEMLVPPLQVKDVYHILDGYDTTSSGPLSPVNVHWKEECM